MLWSHYKCISILNLVDGHCLGGPGGIIQTWTSLHKDTEHIHVCGMLLGMKGEGPVMSHGDGFVFHVSNLGS